MDMEPFFDVPAPLRPRQIHNRSCSTLGIERAAAASEVRLRARAKQTLNADTEIGSFVAASPRTARLLRRRSTRQRDRGARRRVAWFLALGPESDSRDATAVESAQ
jgi:type VI protein secretion system component VasK